MTASSVFRVTEDDRAIKIETDKLEAVIPKKNPKHWMTGIEKGSFLDKTSGFREAGDGLMVVDWIMESGSDRAYCDVRAGIESPRLGSARDCRGTATRRACFIPRRSQPAPPDGFCAPAYREHFLDFIRRDASGRTLLDLRTN